MIDHLKGAWRSWVIRFNMAVGALASVLPMAQDSFPQLQPYIPANVFQYAMAALIIGNMLLRFKTSGSLADKVTKDYPTT